ncbi:VWA-like domain-containing protein [Janibacter limosus]|uniref:VWA-like domain-containing protein n=1 Tax=Janibacter limosus TaxID=53458 RepID=A0AC61U5I4_9MICO|nr:VWA-like domain-containing protein [Janibacter limosus]UUZ45244.1 VWA-like domain-containing protein [Janibacter limosus]
MQERPRLEGELLERWAAGRLLAVQEAPYLASALLALRPVLVEVPGSQAGPDGPLAGYPVDAGWRVHIDPVRPAVTAPRELAYWLLHPGDPSHPRPPGRGVRAAGARGGPPAGAAAARSEPARRWAVAADLEVNDDLPDSLRPERDLRAGRLGLREGLLAEDYWDRLERVSLTGVRDCGGGATGQPMGAQVRRQPSGPGSRGCCERRRPAGCPGGPGAHDDVPGGWTRWARESPEPVVDWRRELRVQVRKGVGSAAGRVDHTYRRRSRRDGVVPGVILPGSHRPEAVVAVVIDTSQSMSQAHLDRAVAEIDGVIRAAGVARRGVSVLCCDSAAFAAGRVMLAKEVRLLGGGGTDMREGLGAAARLRPRPDVVVVLTDGWTDWPERAPRGCPVVVALVDGEVRPPHWAQVVDIDLSDLAEG